MRYTKLQVFRMPEHQQEAVVKALQGETVTVSARSYPFSMNHGKSVIVDNMEPAVGGAEISENVFWDPIGNWLFGNEAVNMELYHARMSKETFKKVEKARKAARAA